VIAGWWRFSERLACLPRAAWRRQGGVGFAGCRPGVRLVRIRPRLRTTGGGGKDLPVRRTQRGPPEAKSLGTRAQTKQTGQTE